MAVPQTTFSSLPDHARLATALKKEAQVTFVVIDYLLELENLHNKAAVIQIRTTCMVNLVY